VDDLHRIAQEHVPTVLKFLEDKQLDMDHLIKELNDTLRKRIIGESEEVSFVEALIFYILTASRSGSIAI
jgi:hypothetical protein